MFCLDTKIFPSTEATILLGSSRNGMSFGEAGKVLTIPCACIVSRLVGPSHNLENAIAACFF